MPRKQSLPETSKLAYDEIRANGLLEGMQLRALELVCLEGPLTGREINKLGDSTSLHKRLSELERLGVVSQVGRRVCTVSGKLAMIWDSTGNLPVEPPPSTESKESLREIGIRMMQKQWPPATRPAAIKLLLTELQADPDDPDDGPDSPPDGAPPEGGNIDIYDLIDDM